MLSNCDLVSNVSPLLIFCRYQMKCKSVSNVSPRYITLKSPAQRVTLELKGCPVDANGFCPLDKFDNVMNTAAK
ncbi:hypothetical protein EK509_06485 [Salmonella enterica]|nr:hypothetical protein [Salmonella enterica]